MVLIDPVIYSNEQWMQYPLYGLSIFQRPFLLLDVISVAKRTQPDCSFQCSLQSSCEIISEMLNSSLKEDLEVSFSVMNCRRFFEILLYFFLYHRFGKSFLGLFESSSDCFCDCFSFFFRFLLLLLLSLFPFVTMQKLFDATLLFFGGGSRAIFLSEDAFSVIFVWLEPQFQKKKERKKNWLTR